MPSPTAIALAPPTSVAPPADKDSRPRYGEQNYKEYLYKSRLKNMTDIVTFNTFVLH